MAAPKHMLAIRGLANILVDDRVLVQGVTLDFRVPFDLDGALESGHLQITDKVAVFTADIVGVRVNLPTSALLDILQGDLVVEVEEFVKGQV